MAITGVNFEFVAESDLRDSAGHTMRLVKLNGFEGTYATGGVILNPEWFGLSELLFLTAEPTTSLPLSGPTEPWTLISFNSLMRVDQGLANGGDPTGVYEWRLLPFITDGQGGWSEVADGDELNFPAGFEVVLLLVGAP